MERGREEEDCRAESVRPEQRRRKWKNSISGPEAAPVSADVMRRVGTTTSSERQRIQSSLDPELIKARKPSLRPTAYFQLPIRRFSLSLAEALE